MMGWGDGRMMQILEVDRIFLWEVTWSFQVSARQRSPLSFNTFFVTIDRRNMVGGMPQAQGLVFWIRLVE
jgi:hypothetical protein